MPKKQKPRKKKKMKKILHEIDTVEEPVYSEPIISPMNSTQEVLLKTNDIDPKDEDLKPFKATFKRGSILGTSKLSQILNKISEKGEKDSPEKEQNSDSDNVIETPMDSS